jgi:hypothetical protein
LDPVVGVRYAGGLVTSTEHFLVTTKHLSPQPWMQLRQVATRSVDAVVKAYNPADGTPKNDLVQTVQTAWTNTTPISQWVYGLMTRAGSQVTLQCRSRGYLSTRHAVHVGSGVPTLTMAEVSRFGIGSDLGNGGILNVGGAYAISELRQNSVTMPLQPHLTGWLLVAAGQTVTAAVEVRFVSEFWEGSMIDGGDGNTESKIAAGELRLDLFAVPVIAPPPGRVVPTVVGSSTNSKVGLGLTVTKPVGVAAGDVLVAIAANQFGIGESITAPAGFTLLHSVNDGLGGTAGAHLRIFTKVATGSEPASYAFGNDLLAEEIVHIVALRNCTSLIGDANSSGWAVASTRRKWSSTGSLHITPSLSRPGQLLICASFYGRTDNPLDQLIGPEPGTQASPAGMTTLVDRNGTSASMNVAYLANPPNPTGERVFTPSPRAFFSNHAISVSLLIPGVPA